MFFWSPLMKKPPITQIFKKYKGQEIGNVLALTIPLDGLFSKVIYVSTLKFE